MAANLNTYISEAAFRQLYDEYKNRLYGYVLTLVHAPDAAEEITQEIFIKLWLCRDKLGHVVNLEHYLFTTARYKTLNYLRKAANDLKLKTELQNCMVRQPTNNVEEQMKNIEQQRLIEEALSRLSPQRRLVFMLSRYQGLSLEEIAERQNLSRNTIKNHLVAALRFIRGYLVKEGIIFFLVTFLLLK